MEGATYAITVPPGKGGGYSGTDRSEAMAGGHPWGSWGVLGGIMSTSVLNTQDRTAHRARQTRTGQESPQEQDSFALG